MKFIFSGFTALILLVSVSSASAGPHVVGNGGDANEMTFKEIALNIEQWIETDQAKSLKLPQGLLYSDYKSRMLSVLKSYSISFTVQSLIVSEAEKTCVNAEKDRSIICNSIKFIGTLKDDRGDAYRLIHHEFAGLAGIEVNDNADSDYRISSQIAGSLYQESVSRLPVNNPGDLQLTQKPLCLEVAYRALINKYRATKKQITFLGGAIVGDGSAVVEVDMFSVVAGTFVNGQYRPARGDGTYKIEFYNNQADGCMLKESDAEISKINL